jgi:DNA polymerase III epsilon subunit family exonuclease
MNTPLEHSMMHSVLFPPRSATAGSKVQENLLLQRVIKYQLDDSVELMNSPIVIFDFETSGLDKNEDEIIEIGAIKLIKGKIVDQFSTLVKPSKPISEVISKLCGITNEMLDDAPDVADVWLEFLGFFDGNVLFAHNAEFDMSFLWATSTKLGYQMQWPAVCTLKMARQILPDLPSKSLDALATHYNIQFESRHRSIGDAKVTAEVLWELLEEPGVDLKLWKDFESFQTIKR